MRTSEKTEQVCASMFAVQRDVELPKTNTKGQAKGQKEYRYLDLPGLIDHLKPHLKAAQLFVTQEELGEVGGVSVITTVWHFSGQFLEFGPAFIPSRSNDPQDVGAAITYARRYALAAVFNLASDKDDDAAQREAWGKAALHDAPSRPAPHTSAGESVDTPAEPGAPARDSAGQGADPNRAPVYLTKDDQALLGVEFGTKAKAVAAYRKRFGERIKRLDDITYLMRDEMESNVVPV